MDGNGGLLDRLVNKVNESVKKIDLSGIKTPTIKTDNSFSFKNPLMIVGLAVAAWLLFKMFGRKRKRY